MVRGLRFMAAHPWVVLALALALSALTLPSVYDFRAGAARVSFEPAGDRLVARTDEAGALYARTRRLFGSDETMIIGLLADDAFASEPLASLLRVSRRIRELPGVHHVSSLATIPVPRADSDGIGFAPLLGLHSSHDESCEIVDAR